MDFLFGQYDLYTLYQIYLRFTYFYFQVYTAVYLESMQDQV